MDTSWVGPAAEVGGSIVGQLMAQGNYDQIAKLREEAMQRFGKVDLATLEQLAKEQLGPSQLGGVAMDSNYKSTQDAALKKLMGIAESDGMDAQSQQRLHAARQEAFGVARGLTGAANQDLAQRGMLGSGAQVQGALTAQQGGINREYDGAIRASSDASQRALEALMAGGKMATGMGQNDLAQKNLAAGANDRIAQFNLGHKTDAEQALVDARLRIAGGQNVVGNQQAGDQAESAQRTKDMAQGTGRVLGTAWDYGTGKESKNSGGSSNDGGGAYPPGAGQGDNGDDPFGEWDRKHPNGY